MIDLKEVAEQITRDLVLERSVLKSYSLFAETDELKSAQEFSENRIMFLENALFPLNNLIGNEYPQTVRYKPSEVEMEVFKSTLSELA